MNEERITLNSHLSKDLFADPLDLLELMMALEEEFDTEINDEDFTHRLDIVYPDMGSFVAPLRREGLSFPPPPRFEGKIGERAIVRNIVELIWENAPYFWENTSP